MDSNDLEFDTFAAIDIVKMEEEVKPEVDHAPADFRSRCNTWPRQQFQQELTPQQQLQQKALQPFFRQADFKDVGGTRVPDFGSNSGLNNLQSGSFLMANRHISTGSPWRTKVATQTGNNGGSPPSTATSGMAPGVGGILPLVSEEDFMDDLGSILSQGTTASNDFDLVSPSTSSMDIGSPSMVNDDVAGHFGSSSSSEMSPKQKTTTRRNPWGNMSYADLITQAIQSSPEQRLTLAQIYDWLVKNIPYFREKGDSVNSIGWKNSIRHNLSLHSRFVRVQNEGTGKSSWWTINPENGKQPNNQVAKHARRRAQTLESASLQSIRPGRRGRTGGGGPSISRRRDSSGSNARTTPVLGRRPSGNQLERASSHQSLVYPDSPILFRHQQSSPDYIHLNNLSMPGQNPSFAGPIHCRTLSNASSCAGGRLSPFRSRASSAYSLDGSQTATTSPSSAWNSQTPPPPTPLPHFNLTEQHLLHDASESRDQERSQSESKDSLNLSPADLDAMRLLDFDSTQLLMALGENDFGDQSFKDQQLTTADSRSEQELQQQLIKSNSKVGHKIKILEPRETATNSDFPTSKFETQPRMWMNQTPSQSFSVYQQQTMDRNATSNTQDKNQFNLNENNYYSAMVDDLLKSAFPTNFDPSDLDLNMFLARGTSDLDSFNSLSAKPTAAEMSQTQIKSELQAFDTMLMKQFDLCNMMSSKPNSTSPSQKYTNSQDLTMIDLATIKSEPLDTKENIDLNPFETMSSKSQSSEHNIANMISTRPNVATNERISSSVSTSASPNSYYSASSNVGGFYRLSNNSNSSSALTLETF